MPFSSKRRAALRAEAHHLRATVHAGQSGITPALIQSLKDALRTHELVKIQIGKQEGVGVGDAANALARATHAEVVQVIGRTAALYRENPDLKKKRTNAEARKRRPVQGVRVVEGLLRSRGQSPRR